MTFFMVDVEANGQSPAVAEMSAFGCVRVPEHYNVTEPTFAFLGVLNVNLYGERPPVNSKLKCTESFSDPMTDFAKWIKEMTIGQPIFISDNNGWDYQWINFYFWKYLGNNPFGHSSYNLGSLYKGLVKNLRQNFKHLRKTKHDHNPVNDCLGNVEAFIHLIKEYKL